MSKPQFLDYGIAQTVYASQGASVDRVILLAERMSKEASYVGTSRAKQGVKVIADCTNKLTKRLKGSSTKENALEYLEQGRGYINRYSRLYKNHQSSLSISQESKSIEQVM